MKIHRKFRFFLAFASLLLISLLLLFVFFATQTALELWDRLQSAPDWLFYGYIGLVTIFVLGGLWFIVKLLLPTSSHKSQSHKGKVTEQSLQEEIVKAEESGVDTRIIRQEIEALNELRESGQVYVSFFGDVSTGKSSIIKALIPDANVKVNVQGGSTQDITKYTWKSTSGDKLVLTDLPGRNEADGSLDSMVQDEAMRSQVVIYVVDSDISRSQYDDIQTLLAFGKPLVVAVNKVDRYDDGELQKLRGHLQKRFVGQSVDFAFTSSGGAEEVVRIYPDGREETTMRARSPDVSDLAEVLQSSIDSQFDTLNQLRDASVFVFVQKKLDKVKQEHCHNQANKMVSSATRRAVFGAMASVSPGTDIIVQGAIGTIMVKDLCKLYDVPVRQLDIDKFLDFSQGQLKNTLPLIMAVAGNGFKAFPGVGTVAGGLIHAVAYGLIFNALGKAIIHTLEQRGRLQAAPATLRFKELLGENMESNAKLFAKLVLEKNKK